MVENLRKMIDRAAVVSFDIFDTLILRGVVRPVDLFAQVALEGGEPPETFSALRVDSEREARRRAWATQQRTEVTLEEIYDVLCELADEEEAWTCRLMNIERGVERRCCRRNPYLHSVYEYALTQGKQVIFVSDIYLDEDLIRTLLHDNGYDGYSELFISSSHGETKSTGKLYRIALERIGVPPGQVLHIGDDHDTDVRMAEKLGLMAWHYPKCLDRLEKSRPLKRRLATLKEASSVNGSEALAESTWQGLAINRRLCHRNSLDPGGEVSGGADTFWQELGYVHVGIFYLGLVTWLRRKLVEEGADRVYFLSRDGYIMKELYDRLLASGAKGPPAHYLYASRRAFNLAAIDEVDENNTDFLVSGTSRLTVAQFLTRISIDPAACSVEIAEAGLPGAGYPIESGEDYGRLRALFRTLAPHIKARAVEERGLLHTYLEDMGVLDGGDAAIVDIGWHGSLQHSLNRVLAGFGADTRLTGYYLGTFPPAGRFVEAGDRHRGYLCECGEPQWMHRAIKESVEIFEWIFSSHHGSVIRFVEGVDGVEPVLEESEEDAAKMALAHRMQRGALEFVDEFLSQWELPERIVIPPALAVRPLLNLLRGPSLDEARKLGDLPHAEGFGDVYVQRPIAKPSGTLLNPFCYHRLVDEYRAAFWRRGYRKRLLGF